MSGAIQRGSEITIRNDMRSRASNGSRTLVYDGPCKLGPAKIGLLPLGSLESNQQRLTAQREGGA